MFENLREDWTTHGRDAGRAGFWVMAVYRFGRWRPGIRWGVVRLPFSLLYRVMSLLVQMATGIVLPTETVVGRRLRFDHFGGIIIHGNAVLGDDCILRHGVTIGIRRADDVGAPVIGNRVDIGAGAAVLGPIHIGDDVMIGANAVVLEDVPSNSTAVGVPARILPRR